MTEFAGPTGQLLTQLAQSAQVGLERQKIALMDRAQNLNEKRVKHEISRDSSMDPLVRSRVQMEIETAKTRNRLADNEAAIAQQNADTNKKRAKFYSQSVQNTRHANNMVQLETEFKTKQDMFLYTDMTPESLKAESAKYTERYDELLAMITSGEIADDRNAQDELSKLATYALIFYQQQQQAIKDKAAEDAAKIGQKKQSGGLVEGVQNLLKGFTGSKNQPASKTLPSSDPKKTPAGGQSNSKINELLK